MRERIKIVNGIIRTALIRTHVQVKLQQKNDVTHLCCFCHSGDDGAADPKLKRKKYEMTIEDEAWRSYLESDSVGLTIASSDEDTAGALATLYEYYKVPVTKRQKIAVSASNSPTPKVIKVEPESSVRQTINVTTSPTGGITLATKPKSPQSDFRSAFRLV